MSDAEVFELLRRVSELERRVTALDGGMNAPPSPTADAQVLEMARSGNTIGAIKRYRELTGVGLAEAKDAVEALQRGVRLG